MRLQSQTWSNLRQLLGELPKRRVRLFVLVLLASLVWKETPHRAVGLPHLSNRRSGLVLEGDPPVSWPVGIDQLSGDEQSVRLQPIGSGVALVQRLGDAAPQPLAVPSKSPAQLLLARGLAGPISGGHTNRSWNYR